MLIFYSAVRRAGPRIKRWLELDPPDLLSSYADLKGAAEGTEAFGAFMAIHKHRRRSKDSGDDSESRGVPRRP